MTATFGLSGLSSYEVVAPPLCSVNKSQVAMWSEGLTKVCTKCGVEKFIGNFRTYTGRGRYGRRPLCKICQREYEKGWRSQSTEYRRKQRAKRSAAHKIYSREYRAKNRAKYLIGECRRRCEKRGWAFNLDQYEDAIQARIDAGVCELTGYPLELKPVKGRPFNTPSIDRIKPEVGYVYSNIRVICFAANAMLGDWGEEAALMMVRSWTKATA